MSFYFMILIINQILTDYYDFLNDNDYYDNNTTATLVEDVFLEN